MPAIVEHCEWTAYCEDCDWESSPYIWQREADTAAERHNEKYHKEES